MSPETPGSVTDPVELPESVSALLATPLIATEQADEPDNEIEPEAVPTLAGCAAVPAELPVSETELEADPAIGTTAEAEPSRDIDPLTAPSFATTP